AKPKGASTPSWSARGRSKRGPAPWRARWRHAPTSDRHLAKRGSEIVVCPGPWGPVRTISTHSWVRYLHAQRSWGCGCVRVRSEGFLFEEKPVYDWNHVPVGTVSEAVRDRKTGAARQLVLTLTPEA